MLDPNEIRRRIAESLPGSEGQVRDMTGTGDHFEAWVVSEAFTGKPMLEQHQLVYRPLQDLLRTGELHALALKTFSPSQWKSERARKEP